MIYDREKCVIYFKSKYNYMKAPEIELLYDIACDIYINTKYPFGDKTTISQKDLEKHPTWFLRCIQEIIEREGLSNVIGYSENGVSMTFEKTGLISQALTDEIIGEAGVI